MFWLWYYIVKKYKTNLICQENNAIFPVPEGQQT